MKNNTTQAEVNKVEIAKQETEKRMTLVKKVIKNKFGSVINMTREIDNYKTTSFPHYIYRIYSDGSDAMWNTQSHISKHMIYEFRIDYKIPKNWKDIKEDIKFRVEMECFLMDTKIKNI